jgi:hypothetical protein
MRNISFGQILVLIIFIVLPVANYFLARMRRRFEPPSPIGQPMPDMGLRRQKAAAVTPMMSPAPGERAQAAAPMETRTPAMRRWSRKTLFRTRRDVRRVMVAATILGPCRAYDPPG